MLVIVWIVAKMTRGRAVHLGHWIFYWSFVCFLLKSASYSSSSSSMLPLFSSGNRLLLSFSFPSFFFLHFPTQLKRPWREIYSGWIFVGDCVHKPKKKNTWTTENIAKLATIERSKKNLSHRREFSYLFFKERQMARRKSAFLWSWRYLQRLPRRMAFKATTTRLPKTEDNNRWSSDRGESTNEKT